MSNKINSILSGMFGDYYDNYLNQNHSKAENCPSEFQNYNQIQPKAEVNPSQDPDADFNDGKLVPSVIGENQEYQNKILSFLFHQQIENSQIFQQLQMDSSMRFLHNHNVPNETNQNSIFNTRIAPDNKQIVLSNSQSNVNYNVQPSSNGKVAISLEVPEDCELVIRTRNLHNGNSNNLVSKGSSSFINSQSIHMGNNEHISSSSHDNQLDLAQWGGLNEDLSASRNMRQNTNSTRNTSISQFGAEESDEEDWMDCQSTNMFSDEEDAGKLQEFNILLLGETGSGKSTTINAIANYLKYSSIEEAMQGDFEELISSSFTLPHPKTGKPYEVQSGLPDYNEVHYQDGSSRTQSPTGYVFRYRNGVIRIIDTPGMGDTRGMEVDKENFSKILALLNQHRELHGIVILIKTSETRHNASFRYCINELLAQLHKSAVRNIFFCFTFGRNSFYGPGDGFSTVKSYLARELHETGLQVQNGINSFFVDNEAYRFLVAKKQGYPFAPDHEKKYEESWNKSAQNIRSMIQKIMKVVPHNLHQTQSLNYARKLILDLAEPMVRIQKNILDNIAKIESYRNILPAGYDTRSRSINVKDIRLEITKLVRQTLDQPKTVCTNDKCIIVTGWNDERKVNYNSDCHLNCRCVKTLTGTIGAGALRNCSVMNSNGQCIKCRCTWAQHKHETFKYVKVAFNILSKEAIDAKRNELDQRFSSTSAKHCAVAVLDDYLSELQMELVKIQNTSAQFAVILQQHSNTSHNKFLEPYMEKLIDEELKMISSVPNYPHKDCDLLRKLLKDHKKLMSTMQYAKLTLADIPRLRDGLGNLPLSGDQFVQIIRGIKLSEKEHFKNADKLALELESDF